MLNEYYTNWSSIFYLIYIKIQKMIFIFTDMKENYFSSIIFQIETSKKTRVLLVLINVRNLYNTGIKDHGYVFGTR